MDNREEVFDLVECGRRACEKLWDMTKDKETPHAERVKLLQWFAAMGIGTPRQMPDVYRAGIDGSSGGVVILPAVQECDHDSDLTV